MEDRELDRPEETPLRDSVPTEEEPSLLSHPVWGRVAFYLASAVVIGVLIFLLVPSQRGGPDRHRRVRFRNQLRQIGVALLNYESHHGQFPPAYVPDDEGRPMHSWRVLILPYLEYADLHAQYDFDQPWDHPGNLPLLELTPGAYKSPWDTKEDPPGLTPCVAFSAEATVLGTTQGAQLADISQDLGEIPVVVGNFQTQIPWTEPTDISPQQWVDLHSWMVENKGYPAQAVNADGSVKPINLRDPPEDVSRRSVIDRPAAAAP